jgi:hypothetical protein
MTAVLPSAPQRPLFDSRAMGHGVVQHLAVFGLLCVVRVPPTTTEDGETLEEGRLRVLTAVVVCTVLYCTYSVPCLYCAVIWRLLYTPSSAATRYSSYIIECPTPQPAVALYKPRCVVPDSLSGGGFPGAIAQPFQCRGQYNFRISDVAARCERLVAGLAV